MTRFWKISPNATFYNWNIYNKNEEWEHPINLKVVTICSSHLELPENNWKYFEKFRNPFAVVTINCVILCILMWWFSKIESPKPSQPFLGLPLWFHNFNHTGHFEKGCNAAASFLKAKLFSYALLMLYKDKSCAIAVWFRVVC